MKKIVNSVFALMLVSYSLISCAQSTPNKEVAKNTSTPAMEKQATLGMDRDSLDNRVIEEIVKEVVDLKIKLTDEALSTIADTQDLLHEINEGKKEEAIAKSKALIGNFEILLAKDPSLAFLPVDVKYQKKELVTDIPTVRSTVKLAKEAMNDGYYQVASELLNNLRSELIVSTYLIPTATYPEAIKAATVLLEADDKEGAAAVLEEVLSTVVIEEKVHPLPVLNAEQLIIEAATIDNKDHNNADQVIILLKNAEYQLSLAEEMGYGKKDKEYRVLSKTIKELKKSVEDKKDSSKLFDELKNKVRKFEKQLFSDSNK